MIRMSLAEAAAAVDGVLAGISPAQAEEPVIAVATDSRLAGPGMLFVAIPGERVDGHDFAASARAAGAAACLVARPVDGPAIQVPDTVLAMGRLAAVVRQRLTGCKVLAITGSSGKTSTKNLLAEVLGRLGPTIAPEGSFNTEVGVPMTIFRADEGIDYLVLEMGMRGAGHIATLCQIARPQAGIILNAGSAHLGMMGSREAIVEAKGEILDLLPADGFAVLPGDDPALLAQAHRTAARVLTFGEGPQAQVRAEGVCLDDQARAAFTLVAGGQSARVRLQAHGRHFVANALAVAATCLGLGQPLDWIAEAISACAGQGRWRMEVHRRADGITVINDAYNANPESSSAALAALAAMGGEGRRWAILGEMLELGEASESEHARIGRSAAGLGVRLVCVGPGTQAMHEAALADGGMSHWAADPQAAIDLLDAALAGDDIVLVKASRGIGLERVASRLLDGVESIHAHADGGQG